MSVAALELEIFVRSGQVRNENVVAGDRASSLTHKMDDEPFAEQHVQDAFLVAVQAAVGVQDEGRELPFLVVVKLASEASKKVGVTPESPVNLAGRKERSCYLFM